jgi:hypothetical protein
MDALQTRLAALVEAWLAAGESDADIYQAVRAECGLPPVALAPGATEGRPRLTEPWFCCSEPTAGQLDPFNVV